VAPGGGLACPYQAYCAGCRATYPARSGCRLRPATGQDGLRLARLARDQPGTPRHLAARGGGGIRHG